MIAHESYKDYFADLPMPDVTARDGCFVNFMGVQTDLSFLTHLPTRGDWVDNPCYGPGIPDVGWGETFFEWISIVDALREARERFVMLELGGGTLLAIGLLTRLWAVQFVGFMAVTAIFVTNKAWFWTDQGMEMPLLLMVVAIVICIRGGHHWSIDRNLSKEF